MKWLFIVAALLVGCATAPKTSREYLAASYASIASAADTVASLAEGKVIRPDQAVPLLDRLDTAKKATDEGATIIRCRDAAKTGPVKTACGTEALAQLRVSLAKTILLEVNAAIEKARQ
jgi:hypothetical protein